jgi:3',5'-cyclic AMP phosphodiesterase CpdA
MRTLKLIHLSDLHLVPPGATLCGVSVAERLDRCLADIARHHADADLCVVTGDLTENGDSESYRHLQSALSRFPIKTQLLLGNCDDRRAFTAVFGGASDDGFVQSATILHGHRLVFLDTLAEPGAADGGLDAPRLTWLQRQLAEPGPHGALLFMHHPPFRLQVVNDEIRLRDDQAFLKLVGDGSVRHIFFGHVHRPVSGAWQGVTFSSVPGLPFQLPLVAGSVSTRVSDEPPMYAVVTVTGSQVTVHSDAYLDRQPAQMAPEAERGNWY